MNRVSGALLTESHPSYTQLQYYDGFSSEPFTGPCPVHPYLITVRYVLILRSHLLCFAVDFFPPVLCFPHLSPEQGCTMRYNN